LIAPWLVDDATAAATDNLRLADIRETAHTTLPEEASNIPDAPAQRKVSRVCSTTALRVAKTE
jgi:hypothetical protein